MSTDTSSAKTQQAILDVSDIGNLNPTAKTYLSKLASRERTRDLNIDVFERRTRKEGSGVVNHDESVEFFKALHTKGVGTFVPARGDKPNMFLWNFDIGAIAKAALGQKVDAQDMEPINKEGEAVVAAVAEGKEPAIAEMKTMAGKPAKRTRKSGGKRRRRARSNQQQTAAAPAEAAAPAQAQPNKAQGDTMTHMIEVEMPKLLTPEKLAKINSLLQQIREA